MACYRSVFDICNGNSFRRHAHSHFLGEVFGTLCQRTENSENICKKGDGSPLISLPLEQLHIPRLQEICTPMRSPGTSSLIPFSERILPQSITRFVRTPSFSPLVVRYPIVHSEYGDAAIKRYFSSFLNSHCLVKKKEFLPRLSILPAAARAKHSAVEKNDCCPKILNNSPKNSNDSASKKFVPTYFEAYWSAAAIQKGLEDGSLYQGILHIPAFDVTTALIYVIRKDSLTAQGGEWKRRTKVGTETFKITDFFGRNRAFHGDEVIVSLCKPPTSVGKESNLSATFQSTPSEVETISSPAIHSIGEVEAPCFATAETYLPSMTSEFPHTLSLSSPLEEATPASPHLHIKEKIPAKDFTDASAAHTEWTDYCRIIGISKPSIHRKSIVCQLKPQNCAFNRVDVASNEKKSKNEVPPIKYIKLQPRDFRLPPFQLNVETLSKVDKEHIHSSLVIEKETLVLVDFEEWNIHSILPTASICPLGFLGETGRISTENFATLIHYKLPHRPHIKESLKEITSLNCHSPSSSLPLWLERAMEDNHRRDCRDLDAFTIDPPSAKDLDDSIDVLPLSDGNYRIGVHIADVSHFVEAKSKLDEEARKRATSVYFDNKVFPMLPSILSENLCSLLPNKDRLTFSVFFVLSSEGLLLESPKPEIIKTITRSRRRLDYALVERFLEDVDKNYLGLKDSFFPLDGPLPSLYEEKTRARLLHHLHPISKTWKLSNSTVISLLILRHMARLRRKIRQKEGSIVLFQGKHTILLNYDPKTELPFDMQYEWPSPTSHGIIEECMILANRCVAMRLCEHDVRFNSILRHHPNSEISAVKAILSALPELQKKMIFQHFNEDGPIPLDKLLLYCQSTLSSVSYQAICFGALQHFNAAMYFPVNSKEENEWKHWALALSSYMHFTSPIRRYADLYIHRILSDVIYNRQADISMEDLQLVCEQCNTQSKAAANASLSFRSFFFNEFLKIRYPLGMLYSKAVVTKIIIPEVTKSADCNTPSHNTSSINACTPSAPASHSFRSTKMKAAVEIFLPLIEEYRSLSLDTLGVCLLENSQNSSLVDSTALHTLPDTAACADKELTSAHSTALQRRISPHVHKSSITLTPKESEKAVFTTKDIDVHSTKEGMFPISAVKEIEKSTEDRASFAVVQSNCTESTIWVRPIDAAKLFWTGFVAPLSLSDLDTDKVKGRCMRISCFDEIVVTLSPGKMKCGLRIPLL